MNSRLSPLCRSLSRVAYAVFLLLFAVTAVAVFKYGYRPSLRTPALLCVAGLVIGVLFLHLAGKLALRLGAPRTLVLLLLLCVLVKLTWVLLVPVAPKSDYLTFYQTAEKLLNQPVLSYPRYVALFPHILGYSQFLSLAMALFGTGYLVAPLLNVALSTLSAGLLFCLGSRLADLRVATAATLLWIICPSQTIYNIYTLSEPLYTALILLFFCLLAGFHRREQRFRYSGFLWGTLCGVLLAAINAVRPIAVILVIGLILWLGLLQTDRWREREFRIKWLPFVAALLVLFLAAGALWNSYSAARLGEEPASTPGFNILVGLNPDSGGVWNPEDSKVLNAYNDQPGSTPQGVQEQLFEDALDRAFSGQINYPRLFLRKLHVFLGVDSACVQYAEQLLPHPNLLRHLCNGFYFTVVIFSLVAAAVLLRRGDRSLLFIPMVYLIGLILAQLLVEVAGRYHYSLIPTLCLLGGWGAVRISLAVSGRRSTPHNLSRKEN